MSNLTVAYFYTHKKELVIYNLNKTENISMENKEMARNYLDQNGYKSLGLSLYIG